VTGAAERAVDILAYWHAVEMFDPQGIPAPPTAREQRNRRPGSDCVERIRLAPGAAVPPLPWQSPVTARDPLLPRLMARYWPAAQVGLPSLHSW